VFLAFSPVFDQADIMPEDNTPTTQPILGKNGSPDSTNPLAGNSTELGVNVIADGGFENTVLQVKAANPNGYWGSTGSHFGGTIVRTDEDKHSGNYSLKVMSGFSEAAYAYQFYTLENSTYTFSFWYKGTSGDGTGTISGWGPPPNYLGGSNSEPKQGSRIDLGSELAPVFPMDGQWHQASVVNSPTAKGWFLDGKQIHCSPGSGIVPDAIYVGDSSVAGRSVPLLCLDDFRLVEGQQLAVAC
jgi:hypothetical protein